MNSEDLKNNINYSDILEKFNYSYIDALMHLYNNYIFRIGLDSKAKVEFETFFKKFITKFTVSDFLAIADQCTHYKVYEFISAEIKNPENKISETIQGFYLSTAMQRQNMDKLYGMMLNNFKELKYQFEDIEHAFKDISAQLDNIKHRI